MPLRECEVHVGADDRHSVPENVRRLLDLLDVPVRVVAGNGHTLDKAYVGGVLDRWIGRKYSARCPECGGTKLGQKRCLPVSTWVVHAAVCGDARNTLTQPTKVPV